VVAPAWRSDQRTKLIGGSEVHLETYSADLSISKGFLFLILTPASDKCSSTAGQTLRRFGRLTAGWTSGNPESDEMFVGLKIAPPVMPFSLVAEAGFFDRGRLQHRANFSF